MAAGGPVRDLCDEATCPICLDYFKKPVTITECGHNFCQDCLTQCWGETGSRVSCPQCREIVQQRNFIPNRQLANFVEIAKKFNFQKDKEKGRVCEKHQEPFKLFCKEEEIPICVVCDEEHKYHNVVLLEEASLEYKVRISKCLPTLKKQREKILQYKADAGKESQELLEQVETSRQKTVAEFKQLHQCLEDQEKRLLAQMEEVEKEIATRREEQVARLSEELASLESVIQEMEKKYQQPASELLQGVGNTMKRCEGKETFENPVTFPLALKWRIWDLCDINSFLEAVSKQFKGILLPGLWLQKANITLNPDTAHPQLILSEDYRSVRMGCRPRDLPKNPERFDQYSIVLGCEGFTAGRHFWEVSVDHEEEWAMGVARKSLGRKGIVVFNPQEGIWGVGKWAGGYRATNYPHSPHLSLSEEPKRIRVSLNYEAGQVTFFNADSSALLYTFSAASFSGETLHPFFWVYEKGYLGLSP
ncbi:zinc finger protein RFP-like [Hemicordylus capensis]|uniref:zinc finger protein RFP-like n=1 Tax=Hemicordylus capensis TaxID=884348 RepID=UPI002304D0DE|nr:zinc finger protein RFP-like [Hemicordylus capensis]